MTPFKAEIQLYLELIVATKGAYVSISMNLDKWKKYTNGTDCSVDTEECGNSNSFLLQVFIYKNEHIADWKVLKDSNDIEGKKNLATDGKWGIVKIIIPERNCDVMEIDSLSSTDVVNEYRQLLLQVPAELPQFDIIDNDFKSSIFPKDIDQAPCNEIKSFINGEIEIQKELLKPKVSGVTIKPEIEQRHSDVQYLETMYQRYFRCGFKATFSGALKRVFAGMNAVQKYEVTMIRKYKNSPGVPFCLTGDGTCFVAEFSLQSKFAMRFLMYYE